MRCAHAPWCAPACFGPVSYRDIEIAEGRASAPPDGKPLDSAAVNGVFQDCDIEELQAVAAAAAGRAQAGSRHVRRPRRAHPPGPDAESGPAVRTPVRHRHGRCSTTWRSACPRRSATAALEGRGVRTQNRPAERRGRGAAPSQIASRDDVVRAIDRICDYYSRYEPSSPVPLLLKRARRLATGSFVDIVRDLAPGRAQRDRKGVWAGNGALSRSQRPRPPAKRRTRLRTLPKCEEHIRGQREQPEVHRPQPRAARPDRVRRGALRRREEDPAALRHGRAGRPLRQARRAAAARSPTASSSRSTSTTSTTG